MIGADKTLPFYIAKYIIVWAGLPEKSWRGKGGFCQIILLPHDSRNARQVVFSDRMRKNGLSCIFIRKGGEKMFQIDKEIYGPSSPRTVRFPDEFFEHLCRLAQENGISFNRFIIYCCKYAVDSMEGR